MRLDRKNGRGKYAIINLRKLEARLADGDRLGNDARAICESALDWLAKEGILEYGEPGTENEFFVIKLKDAYADEALYAYANNASRHGEHEYAADVYELARRASIASDWVKKPD